MEAVSESEDLAWFPVDTGVADFLRLLHAADTFPRGGLYSGYYAIQAALRYERYWAELLKTQRLGKGGAAILPPLDVAYAWLVHRQNPAGYKAAMRALGVKQPHPVTSEQAFGFSVDRQDQAAWKEVARARAQWPPPAPGSIYDVENEVQAYGTPRCAVGLANSMGHFSRLLHTWLRPHFLDSAFLKRAWGRFTKFLRLHAAHPQEVLVPAADVALLWHTYLGLSDKYEEMCARVFCDLQKAQPPALWRPDYLTLSPDQLSVAYGKTAVLYTAAYGEPYADPDTAWIGPEVPYPLAAPGSPVAAFLVCLDDIPRPSVHQPAVAWAETQLGWGQAWSGWKVPRAGAHALYIAWLMSRRAEHFYDNAAYQRCCLPNTLVRTKAISTGVAAVVSCAYFLDLPATSKVGRDSSGAAAANGAAPRQQSQEPQPEPQPLPLPKSAAGGFSPHDPERLLSPSSQEHFMAGLSQLLTAAAGGSGGGAGGGAGGSGAAAAGSAAAQAAAAAGAVSSSGHGTTAVLWSILSAKSAAELAQAKYKSAWKVACTSGDVGRMQALYQYKKYNARDRDHVYYYGRTDYYNAGTLCYAAGADAYAFDEPRRNAFDGTMEAGAAGAGGGGGGDGGGWGGGWGGEGGGGGAAGCGGGGGGGCGGGGGGG
ncbi:hypothetical protein HXX76_009167 [Chlamydomonas incerta]|uniref:Uncharacterized protein n=1 Tax=Chlamydomonas incerta TaxID=51695 RepID=A0A835SS84_CHLIN|nr:hypothetical protein HXX76_009167 [Chlamydomonas incerta]|eukprot:KAG2432249.1 hypothetical protein HXX76_009167 [Chlamydomonas incerta]